MRQVRVEPNPALENALSGILAAQSPSDAVDAYERFRGRMRNSPRRAPIRSGVGAQRTRPPQISYRAYRSGVALGSIWTSGQMSREDS